MSGSVLLTETELKVNTLAYLAQHLVVLLDERAIVSGLQEAYTHPILRTAHYAVFHTGPSATADIEGVLIRGAYLPQRARLSGSRYSVFSIRWLVSQLAWQESGLPHLHSTKPAANPFNDPSAALLVSNATAATR
jgi:hypothetical protein